MMSAHVLLLYKKAVSHIINNHVLTGANLCFIIQAIYILLMYCFFVVGFFFFFFLFYFTYSHSGSVTKLK